MPAMKKGGREAPWQETGDLISAMIAQPLRPVVFARCEKDTGVDRGALNG